MSEKKSTSRSNVNSNPLLSASVTGLTFDEFPNKLTLLPAAPPIVHALVPPPPVAASALGRETTKSLVTVGNSSDHDSENLDEINLNTIPEEIQPARIDTNVNSLLEQNTTTNNDSILSQAASSFSALPSVASSVFSTFSKRIYSGSSSREQTPQTETASGPLVDSNVNPISQLDIQPAYIQKQQQPHQQYSHLEQTAAPPPFYAPQPPITTGANYFESAPIAPPTQSAPLEPPKFYTPAELPTLSSLSGGPPSAATAGGQNTYRLSAKKKIYAPIPGLSEQKQQIAAPVLDTSNVGAPFAPFNSSVQYQQAPSNPYDYSISSDPFTQQQQQPQYLTQPKPEERKGGLFSLTNLVPTGVLQNLSGLVQSAAGTLTQGVSKPAEPTYQPNQSQQQIAPSDVGQFGGVNYFGIPDLQPPTANFYSLSTEPPKQQAAPTNNFFSPSPPIGASPYPQQLQSGLPPLPSTENFLNPISATSNIDLTTATSQNPTGLPVAPPPKAGFIIPTKEISAPPVVSQSFDTNPAAFFQNPPLSNISSPLQQPEFGASLTKTSPTVFGADLGSTKAPETISIEATQTISSKAQPPVSKNTGDYFTPTPAAVALFDPTQQSVNPVTAVSLLDPTQQPSVEKPQQLPAVSFFNPTHPPSLSPAVALFDPSQQTAVGILTPQVTQQSFAGTISPAVSVFDPTLQSSASISRPTAALFDLTQAASTGVPSSALFSPTQQPTFENASTVSNTHPPLSVSAPTAGIQQIPPPTISGQTSFRLQKGTRLYKNPLTSAETAPAYVSSSLELPPAPIHPSTQLASTVFNPLAPQASSVSSIESVELFAPGETTTTDSISLFTAAKSITDLTTESIDNIKPKEIVDEKISPLIATVDLPSSELFACSTVEVKSKDLSELITSIEPAVLQLSNTEKTTVTSFEAQIIEPILPAKEAPELLNSNSIKSVSSDIFDPLEQTLEKLSLAPAEVKASQFAANFLPPPPHSSTTHGSANPYRHTHSANTAESVHPPVLANFFTPAAGDTAAAGGDFNFFATNSATVNSTLNSFSKASQPAFGDLGNIFGGPQETVNDLQPITEPCLFPTLPPLGDIAPPQLEQELPLQKAVTTEVAESITAFELETTHQPPIGFDNLIGATTESQPSIATDTKTLAEAAPTQPEQNQLENISSVNSFSNYFNQTSTLNLSHQEQKKLEQQPSDQKPPLNLSLQQQGLPQEPQQKLPDSTTFFDTFAPQPATAPPAVQVNEDLFGSLTNKPEQQTSAQTAQSNEYQRIQNFFNNPPPKENGGGIGDLNYDLVHSGLSVRNLLQERSLTPASNLVEPPSSSCSEFSELNNSVSSIHLKVVGSPTSTNDNKILNITGTTTADLNIQSKLDVEKLDDSIKVTTSLPAAPEVERYKELPDDILHALRMANLLIGEKGAASAPPTTVSYTPAIKHWFYKRLVGTKHIWTPFSHYDSALLETSWSVADATPNFVAVEGGRYDVNIAERTKVPVYWEAEEPIEVRRCSWFYKANDSKYIPYEEQTANLLEAEYKQAAESGEWHKKIILSMGEQVVFHGPTVLVHFQQQQNVDTWGGSSQTTTRPRVVKRDLDDFTIDQGESQRVDHLLYMVHGIGSACDLKMRTVEEVVDEFRGIAQQLVASHYKNSTEMGVVGRVEVLPISWHGHLHSVELGIDEKLKSITLESIPKLRNFTNDTLLDVLFYTSPTYCQKIMNTVAAALNASYIKYRERHPDFNGGVSLAGHSLGSLILFDLLCHQKPMKECEEQNMENPDQQFLPSQMPTAIAALDTNRLSSINEEVAAKQIRYTMGPAGTGQPFINYAQLIFQPKKFFALGSPIGMFVTIRGIDKLGLDFRLPTCPGFYNIFHPFDPVAYRIEALVNPDMSGIRPVLIPHHKGRKRMHLELKETMTRVGADLKQRFFDTFKTTIDSVNFLGTSTRSKKEAEESMEKEVNKVIEMQMQLEQQQDLLQQNSSHASQTSRQRADSTSTTQSDSDAVEVDFPLGKLNDSKRVDFVLQEAPLEFFNEYLFALSSHVCYWESEDTILFVMKEIYSGLGVSPDSQVPQQTMTIERPSSRNSVSQTLLPPTF